MEPYESDTTHKQTTVVATSDSAAPAFSPCASASSSHYSRDSLGLPPPPQMEVRMLHFPWLAPEDDQRGVQRIHARAQVTKQPSARWISEEDGDNLFESNS